ncbi:MAG: ROK family protein [Eubacteriales bacterium]|nr:ROK family protein [Eubacteriales bacterium]
MPYAQTSVKELNRKAVFELIAEQCEITRTAIAEQTQSTMPTIMKITNFFLEQKMIAPIGIEKTARGRRPQVYRFQPDSLLGVGISYNGCHAVVSLTNYYGRELCCVERDVSETFETMTDTIFPEMIAQVKCGVEPSMVKSIGICLDGSVDTEQLEVHLGGYSQLRFTRSLKESISLLSAKTGLPAYLFNDVNAAATGEYILRKMKNEDLVYIYVGKGTGAGVILNGTLREGKHFYTGEVGHMVFDADHRIDSRKPGWMEAKLSQESIEANAHSQKDRVDYAARYISLIIANICGVLDIENVVLGGELVKQLGQALIVKTQEHLSHLLLFPARLSCYVDQHSELIGGARLAIERQLGSILADSNE